ncbi:unnamed protein product [Penicillium salamii]|uniref:Uncharacterized protein n=1 Tax=Penicillium salamii TaxID=1612424 RepID=A0A9W4NZI9_9EURO|nr:unnamed protein product [Penicillium salamii]CAG8204858.1 unnamed protein product [Penicillium salamii]CAG8211588.1 unnamed protein product [Penicillium salamii]CAG8219826.1 unnamed protein product [Penicillium salamii]CAG8317011.1 unnamed protein product [Penicillium salamii]
MIRTLFTRRAPPFGAALSIPRVRKTGETPTHLRAKLNKTIQNSITRSFTTTQPTSLTASLPRESSPFRSSSKSEPSTFEDVYYSPHQPKRQWPPDMSKLSPKHQFRLERKYRRRAALKYARPKLMKATKIGQWVVIGFVLVYAVLFMEWETSATPFHGVRESFFGGLKSIFSSPPPPGPVRRDVKEGPSSEGSQ